MSQLPREFDDPNLKVTLHRAFQGRTASPETKSSIADLIARELNTAPQAPAAPTSEAPALPFFRRPALRWALAAAAVLILAVGAGIPAWRHHVEERERAEELAANLPLFQTMVDTYDHPTTASDLPITDATALAATLSTRLGRP